MSVYQRFDLDGSTPSRLSDREVKRRWESFHASVREHSDSRMKRIAGRVLGEGTLRYHIPRTLIRPLIHGIARFRPGSTSPPTTRVANLSPFPTDYRPAPSPVPHTAVAFTDVLVVVVDESASNHVGVVQSLNQSIATSQAPWLMIVDVTTTAHDRDVAIGVLRSRADDVVDVLFADEVGPDENAPIFKPSRVGPHTLVSYDVVGRPALVRTSALRAIGGFDPNVGWAFEHDAYLRLLEAKATFRHVDGVLAAGRPPRAFESESVNGDSRAVVRRAFERRGWRGSIDDTPIPGVIAWSPGVPSPLPSIEIIIPTRDRVDLLRNCISTLEAITTYPNYRIMILDNDSAHDETLQYFAATTHRVVACPGPFNYARIMNRGVAHSSADFVVTLNNDTTAVTPDWLEKMVAIAALDDVGIVGGRLLDEHGRAEHESIVIAPYPQHLRTDANYRHVDQFSHALRDVAAVTGALQMVRRELWESLGGMDEELKVTMNDVDLCLRSQNEGRHVVYRPDVTFVHHASSTRGDLDPLDDRNRFVRRWDIFGSFRDPYFPERFELLGQSIHYRST